MKTLIALTDYKNHFGTKKGAIPYRSGFDRAELAKEFRVCGYEVEYYPISDVVIGDAPFSGDVPVIYTSAEDQCSLYKSYIEDIVFGLEISGVRVFPAFRFLRAHENKVFMEILRASYKNKILVAPETDMYGTFEDLLVKKDKYLEFPVVIKSAHGSMSRGVDIARNQLDLLGKAKDMSRSLNLLPDLKDSLRTYIHKGYTRSSIGRNKFLIQSFIPNLDSDWKVLVFGSRYYVFKRPVRKGDFRASGSGHKNYLYGDQAVLPDGMLDFSKSIYDVLNVPHLSLDVAYDGNQFYMIEMQFLYFGTVGQEKSNCFYELLGGEWKKNYTVFSVEKVYAESMARYIDGSSS